MLSGRYQVVERLPQLQPQPPQLLLLPQQPQPERALQAGLLMATVPSLHSEAGGNNGRLKNSSHTTISL